MKPFIFKEFTIEQDRCAMKIGTDAVLLGAWTSLEHNPISILDIGAGTGVLALMLAQRSCAEMIDAIEIDDDAYEQCVENFENSPWGDRLFCYHASLEEFTEDIEDQYDLIVSNPPFYKPTLPSASLLKGAKLMPESRQKARFNDAMPFEHLLESVSKLLSKEGIFSVIIPFKEEDNFTAIAKSFGLFPQQIRRVKGTPETDIKRSLMSFSFNETTHKISELVIETIRHQYTQDYVRLTKDFYIKM